MDLGQGRYYEFPTRHIQVQCFCHALYSINLPEYIDCTDLVLLCGFQMLHASLLKDLVKKVGSDHVIRVSDHMYYTNWYSQRPFETMKGILELVWVFVVFPC